MSDQSESESDEWTPEQEAEFQAQQKEYHRAYLTLIDKFEPDDDDIILFKDDPKWQRLIFPPYEGYRDMENEKYEEFLEFLEEEEFEIPEWMTKRMLIRVLSGDEFKFKEALKNMKAHLEWRSSNLPIQMNDHMKELIFDLGLIYTHGRDRSLRPLTFFQPRVVVGRDINLDQSILGAHFVTQHIIENMMVVGKVENWINILDMAKLGLRSIPKDWIVAFIKSFSANTLARTKCMHLVNCGTAISILWAVLKVFVHWTVKKKMVFTSKCATPDLIESCHPSQLQKNYGGEAENVDHYWPPYYPSGEYGVDTKKLKMKDEHDASIIDDFPIILPDDFTAPKLSEGVTTKIDAAKSEDQHQKTDSTADVVIRRHHKSKIKKAEKGKGACCVIF